MQLVQFLLPLRDNDGRPFPLALYVERRDERVAPSGGVTSWQRAPASGLRDDGPDRQRDDLVLLEVMVESLDRDGWRASRQRLERRLRRDERVLRALSCERL